MASASTVEEVVAGLVEHAAAARAACRARGARATARARAPVPSSAERAVVVVAERSHDSTRSARSAARDQRGDGLLAHVGGNAGDRAELVDELGRGREVMRDLVDRRLAARREHRARHARGGGPARPW